MRNGVFKWLTWRADVARGRAGLPALVVPCGEALPEDGGTVAMPVGMQLIGRPFGEAELLRMGHIFERTRRS